jgi:XTP/dITP diphosphohydrolase
MSKLVVASNNAGKLKEFAALLAPLGFELVPQSALGVTEAEEPHPSFLENALAKARHASRATGLPALADDSGICVPALDGAPGVHSARFAQRLDGGEKSDARNNAKLVSLLEGQADRRAYYYCVLAFLSHADDPQPLIGEGQWWGEVAAAPRGQGGFGYDPHFWLPERSCTAAELDPAEKNRISHRAQALAQLHTRLRAKLGAR